jgi:hypothetical protein
MMPVFLSCWLFCGWLGRWDLPLPRCTCWSQGLKLQLQHQSDGSRLLKQNSKRLRPSSLMHSRPGGFWSVSCSVAVFIWESAFKNTKARCFHPSLRRQTKANEGPCPLETHQNAMELTSLLQLIRVRWLSCSNLVARFVGKEFSAKLCPIFALSVMKCRVNTPVEKLECSYLSTKICRFWWSLIAESDMLAHTKGGTPRNLSGLTIKSISWMEFPASENARTAYGALSR